MIKRFIERPILSAVISILIAILGVLGLTSLPVSQYPEIAPPTVVVSASYQGANAEAVLSSVVVPLEEQINGVENMTYMTSTAGNDGTASITINFELGTNPDIAAVNVQNRVSRATPLLPSEVTRAGVTTSKRQSSNILIFTLYSDNPTFDQTFLTNYAAINLIPQLQRVNGVGDARVFGDNNYAMRIWLKPDVMASYGLVPDDISAVLAEQNVEAAPGQFGESVDQAFQYVLKYSGRLNSEEEFGDIVIRTAENGRILRLRDIARIELASVSYSTSTETNGKPAVGIAISQSAGSNAQEVIDESLKTLEEASRIFPEGINYINFVNANDFLNESIEKVISTLIEAFVLVFLVVYLFLQDFRSTLIPAVTVPVAIVGTFFFLGLFGFTINLLTLFALLLAIGIVVDDAIVVVEAVHAKLDTGYTSAREATEDAMGEITGAIISITLVMAAVFVPVSFITGSTGVFFQQFGLTLAIAIILSAVNALTLSPALCAILLKPASSEKKRFMQRFHKGFNAALEATLSKYTKAVGFLMLKRWIVWAGMGVFATLLVYLFTTTPKGFVPNEDMGVIISEVRLPPSASLDRTEEVVEDVEKIITSLTEVANAFHVTGRGIISGPGSNYGFIITRLKPLEEREGEGQDVPSLIEELFALTSVIREAQVIFFSPPPISGFSISGGFGFQLQDRSGSGITQFAEVSQEFLAALNERPEIQYASTSFNPNFPQFQINVNVEKVKDAGLTVTDILNTLQGYYGGVYASNFNQFGKQYRVMYQAEPLFRTDAESLNTIYVRNANDIMAPISEFISLERVYGPQSINRFNLFTSIDVNGAPASGYSSGDAIQAIEEVALQFLPPGYGYEFSGITREEIASSNQTLFIFLLVTTFVYFLLSAQYESFMLPLAVLFSLPVGLSGTFLFIQMFDIANNIYVQIAVIMLVGLLAKNAILIVEFAVDRRRKGMPLQQATLEGAKARFRPILMTSFSFIAGLLPLVFASGTGANGNQSIGISAVGGMITGTIFGVLVIPILFLAFQSLHEKISGPPQNAKSQ